MGYTRRRSRNSGEENARNEESLSRADPLSFALHLFVNSKLLKCCVPQALNPKSPLQLQNDLGALSDIDLEGQPDSAPLPSFAENGAAAEPNYDHGEAGTSFSSDRAEKASDAEWSSLQNPVHEGKSRVLKVESNVLERDSPLDFSASSRDNNSAPAKSKASAAVTFTPLGDLPAAPAIPTNVAESFAAAQFQKARHLYSVGMAVDPQHGPLYHAYGNMELVSYL